MTAVTGRALAERLARLTVSCSDVEALADVVFRTIATEVPFAFGCLATTDPTTGLITGAIKSAPLPLGDEDFAAAEYGAPDVNQFAEIERRPVPVGVLSVDTDGDVDRCRRLRDYMRPNFGFADEVRLVCRAHDTTWGALAIYRGAGEAMFTAVDGDTLAALHEVIADSMRRVLFAPGTADAGQSGGPAVLVVDGADRVTDMSSAAREIIDELGGWYNGDSVPATISVVAASARASDRPASARARGRSGRWLTVQGLALEGEATGRSVVLSVDATSPSAIGAMTVAARGLTAREQDVAALVLQGASTKAIAAALHLSPHTVQDHLKAIFAKLGVSSRREMVAQLAL